MLSILAVLGASLLGIPQQAEPPLFFYKPNIALEASYTPTIETKLEERQLSIEEKIIKKAEEYHYSTTTALAIAIAESGLNPKAKNASSTASGIYQFIKSTWKSNCSGDVFNEDDNIDCAIRLLSEGGIHHWDASKLIWSKMI